MNMDYRVHIKIADRGWILEKCASEIAQRSTRVTYGTEEDPRADIQYYINYSARRARVSPIEIAFFTHSEKNEDARRRYFDVAREVDHRICMSKRYAEELLENDIAGISTIAPGVDLEAFKPKIRIGVVGRTYHTGRKGEALVAQVMDIPEIEWRFTGAGWPGPSTRISESAMGDFYNDLDYVLIPSLYEGGPMSALEGLACGVPIISADVGWVNEYPHIQFQNGNVDSLRAVLQELVAKRLALRESVLDKTWSAWADEHLQLFDQLAETALHNRAGRVSVRMQARDIGAVLVTHGAEAHTLGGPSVRVPRTATELHRIGVKAVLPDKIDGLVYGEAQVAHIFNLWPIESCYSAMAGARAAGKSVVLSPIFLNLQHTDLYGSKVPALFANKYSTHYIERALKVIAKEVAEEPNLPLREPHAGYHARVRACVANADFLIHLSEYEKRCLEHIGAVAERSAIVRNPVDGFGFANADPSLFAGKYGLEDYILCVGRIEPRKNQLVLAHAAKTLAKKIVFVGHEGSAAYGALVRAAAGDNALFIPRIDPRDPLLKSAFAGATVFCLPSWSEGAPLAALEAAAAGVPLVLSDRSAEREYLGDYAHYINPADIEGIRTALILAAAQKGDSARRLELQRYMAKKFSWSDCAEQTAECYQQVLETNGVINTSADPNAKILVDLTTTFHNSGNPTGIARVEESAYHALLEQAPGRVVPIVWNSRSGKYLKLKVSHTLSRPNLDDLERMEASGDAVVIDAALIGRGTRMLVFGGAWIRNPLYIHALSGLRSRIAADLTVLIHDLIQMKMSHAYPSGTGEEFTRNARMLVSAADRFLVYSEVSRTDLRELLQETGNYFKEIFKFKMGDMLDESGSFNGLKKADDSQIRGNFRNKRFVLFVSSIDVRKNHVLLINVWRRLIQERGAGTPHLVLVGRVFWRGEEVVTAVTTERGLSQFVHILSDVNDGDLDWLYRNAMFTLYPSIYEGWGLPVAESLAYGKLCITSDSTATREISPELTDLLDPYDFRAWLNRVDLYLDNPDALKRKETKIAAEFRRVDWRESVDGILSAIQGARLAAPARFPEVLPQTIIDFSRLSRSALGDAVCIKGWGKQEKDGRWLESAEGGLAMQYLGRGPEIWLRLKMRALTRAAGVGRAIEVKVNDVSHGTIEVPCSPADFDFRIELPVKGTRELNVMLTPCELFSPTEIGAGNDNRLLSVFLISACLADDAAALDKPAATAGPPPSPAAAPFAMDPSRNATTARLPTSSVTLLASAIEFVTPLTVLPSTNRAFRLIRRLRLDGLLLKIYGKIFNRTNEGVRRVIEALQRMQ